MSLSPTFNPLKQELDHPQCPSCGARMWLQRIEPDKPDYDKRSFECPICGALHAEIVKYR
jgi:predicted RNA-binding Zn-ribbon protein involved in translation (DUF1610 family)